MKSQRACTVMAWYLLCLLGEGSHRADLYRPNIPFQSDFEGDRYSISQISSCFYFEVSVAEPSNKTLVMTVGHHSSRGGKVKGFLDVQRSSLPVMAR